MKSNIDRILTPQVKDLGDNFVVRRTLPAKERKMVGPFIFWDHMGPVDLKPGKDMLVRAHPHIGLSTITYLFSGEILHRDSLGNEQFIRPGEVNWMTAGAGIVHSERAQVKSGSMHLEGIQLWLALPKESEGVAPSFVHEKEDSLPLIEGSGWQLRLIAGELLGQHSPLPVFSPLFYAKGTVPAGQSFELQLPEGQEGAIYLVSGVGQVDEKKLETYSMGLFKAGSKMSFQAQADSQFMILGGQPFAEGRHIWWNFVASDKSLIEAAKTRWKGDQFPKVPNEQEFIPLPEN